jgi:hypothetical protein
MSKIFNSAWNSKKDGHTSLENVDSPSPCAAVEALLAQERHISAELRHKIKALENVILAQRVQLEEENARLREEMTRLADLIVKSCS